MLFERYKPALEEELMTLHIVLFTADKSELVWVTDDRAFLGAGNISDGFDKISYSEQHRVACSCWGDAIPIGIRDAFLQCVQEGSFSLKEPSDVLNALRNLGAKRKKACEARPAYMKEQYGHGVIVAVFEGSRPRLYEAFISDNTIAGEVTGQIVVAGDLHNAARMFPFYYCDRSGKSLSECLAIGVHTIRIAKLMNPSIIGNPDVRFYSKGEFRRLTDDEVKLYVNISESIDAKTLDAFRAIPLPNLKRPNSN
jgi:hypothetical protein